MSKFDNPQQPVPQEENSDVERLDTNDERVAVEKTTFDDAELSEFIDKHIGEIQYEGQIDASFLRNLKNDREGYAYKIRELENLNLAGFVGVIRKGKDTGTAEVVYALGKEYEGQGLARPAVEKVASELRGKRLDVQARIDQDNKRSEKLVRSLGWAAFGDDGHGKNTFWAK